MDLSNTVHVIISLATLTLLEVVLGVDNLIFISIASSRLPLKQQKSARRIGLLLALFTRLLLLAFVVWIIGLTKPLFTLFGQAFSGSDLMLIGGGLFLIVKATLEMHHEFEAHEAQASHKRKYANFLVVITQIAIFDIIFSLDSILTAVGLTREYWVMATAIIIAILCMIFASEPLSRIVNRYPTIKMLALSFLLLIGMVLIADGFDFHVPRAYIYFAVCFSVFVEVMNSLIVKRKKNRKVPSRSKKNEDL